MHHEITEITCKRIHPAISLTPAGSDAVRVVLDSDWRTDFDRLIDGLSEDEEGLAIARARASEGTVSQAAFGALVQPQRGDS